MSYSDYSHSFVYYTEVDNINKPIIKTKRERGRRGRDRMVIGFTTTYAIGDYHH